MAIFFTFRNGNYLQLITAVLHHYCNSCQYGNIIHKWL